MLCFFASDLHGHIERYEALFDRVAAELPHAVFLGGDLLPSAMPGSADSGAALNEWAARSLGSRLRRLHERLGDSRPRVLAILGNDDARSAESDLEQLVRDRLLEMVHMRHTTLASFDVYGYSCVPPTPFLLKDWERYDVSRYVEAGCVSPEEGQRTMRLSASEVRFGTIARDLELLVDGRDLSRAILLFHAPPYRTMLDRAPLDGRMVDGVPCDVHVGSIAVRRLIESRQPLVCLHGHVHESPRLTGSWCDRLGRTQLFSAAHDGPELALVRFDPEQPERASRELIPVA
ncbi:MAG: metallophosphoesterase family protein [Acidobacteriota bacterium]